MNVSIPDHNHTLVAANAYLGSAYRDGWRLDGLS